MAHLEERHRDNFCSGDLNFPRPVLKRLADRQLQLPWALVVAEAIERAIRPAAGPDLGS